MTHVRTCSSAQRVGKVCNSTGKERDTETGLDYFGARYYGSSVGRWTTPDWAAHAVVVPYAIFADPQSLNLYGYVTNNPVSRFDLDGHQDGDSHSRRFTTALKNLVSVKTEHGAGYELSGAVGGVKVKAGTGASTEAKYYPLGDKPAEITPKAESKLEGKLGPGKVELKNTGAAIDPETGQLNRGGASASGGVGGENTSGLKFSTDGEISVVGGSVGVGPIKGGVEIVINTPEMKSLIKEAGPAFMEGLAALTGFGKSSDSNGTNPLPGMKLPAPNNSGGEN